MPKARETEKRELAKRLSLEGLTTAAIAERTGVPPPTIRTWKRRGRWADLRLAARRELAVPGRDASPARDLLVEGQTVRETISSVVRDQVEALRELDPGGNLAKVHTKSKALKETVNAASTVYAWGTQDQLAAWSAISKRQGLVRRVQAVEAPSAPEIPPDLNVRPSGS